MSPAAGEVLVGEAEAPKIDVEAPVAESGSSLRRRLEGVIEEKRQLAKRLVRAEARAEAHAEARARVWGPPQHRLVSRCRRTRS